MREMRMDENFTSVWVVRLNTVTEQVSVLREASLTHQWTESSLGFFDRTGQGQTSWSITFGLKPASWFEPLLGWTVLHPELMMRDECEVLLAKDEHATFTCNFSEYMSDFSMWRALLEGSSLIIQSIQLPETAFNFGEKGLVSLYVWDLVKTISLGGNVRCFATPKEKNLRLLSRTINGKSACRME